MDVDFLSGMIAELMLDHDSLNLPGLGTFVAEEMPASFSDRGYTINPPYRRISFTERPSDDSLLADLYAGANPQAPKEAEAVLTAFLLELKEELVQRRSVELPGLGRLRATRENHFFFVADDTLDLSPDSCGLAAVSLKTHCAPSLAATLSPILQETAVEAPPSPAPRRRLGKPARWAVYTTAAAAVFLLAFVALSRIAPDFTDKLLYTQEELAVINYPEDGLDLPR